MAKLRKETLDGNTAATHIAYAFSDVAAIYPITPSSTMGELADSWSASGRKNIFNQTVDVVELQSEGGAAGAVHGSLSAGALTTTFTASQGLMLMLPNMHKIAGEMLPTVFHVSARSLACQSLSIFGDHSDVMSARNTGFALMAAASVQEVMDLALVSHLSSLKAQVPFLNFFDGFRTSSEVQKIEVIDYDTIESVVEMEEIEKFRSRALNPENPKAKVGAQNPDVYFQGRETVNNYYSAVAGIVKSYMKTVEKLTGRKYRLFDYCGVPDADRIIVAMGSGCETIEETINYLNKRGYKTGLVKVRLYRPFSIEDLKSVIPDTVRKIAVLDRTKEPGAIGEPLYLDVVTALKERKDTIIIGGRYGLSSKEFTPSMVKSVYDHLEGKCFHDFTVGIIDDVSQKSLEIKDHINTLPDDTISCKFWGLGADGTVGANKNSIKIIGDNTELYAQGYFQYDSKKSGGITRSHLRFGKSPIQSEYLVQNADFIACHNQAFIGRYDLLEGIKENAVFLLNSNWSQEEVFEKLTREMQQEILDKRIRFYNIDALKIATEVGLGARINTVMQTAFFLISGVLDRDEATKMIKDSIKYTYEKKGKDVVEMNWKAVDKTNEALVEIQVPSSLPGNCTPVKKLISDNADDFTKSVIEPIMREKGDEIPVSKMPYDGFIPSGTTKLEKRGVAPFVPHWIPEKCIQCNQCAFVCPHAAIRTKLIEKENLKNKPPKFKTLEASGKDKDKFEYKVQVFIEDCQGCRACVNECPKKALEMKPISEERNLGENENVDFFETLPYDVLGDMVKEESVKGSQFKQPLMEFSGACAGCGETPYVKLVTQFFGDRMIIANATGCSSIYGGTFPTIPYTKNKYGEGPSWANSLFEDNAEYGFGMRLAVDSNRKSLIYNVENLIKCDLDNELIELLKWWLDNSSSVTTEAKEKVRKIKSMLPACVENKESEKYLKRVRELKNYFIQKSVWAFGGDGWAYDIGYGGLDHVLAANRNLNVLVLDTEVYSNTGGQASKATPLGSVAKFAESGKKTVKKDLGLMLMSYEYIYVASVAMGANKNQLVKALLEAEQYDGPSIIIAYSPCINHGMDMSKAQEEEKLAVDSGYWILYRWNPELIKEGKNPFSLDSKDPTKPVTELLDRETRYSSLKNTFPEEYEKYRRGMEEFVKNRYKTYLRLLQK